MSDIEKKLHEPSLDDAVLNETELEKISGGEGTNEIDGVQYTLTTPEDIQVLPGVPVYGPWQPPTDPKKKNS